jgi:hypothetical protein
MTFREMLATETAETLRCEGAAQELIREAATDQQDDDDEEEWR